MKTIEEASQEYGKKATGCFQNNLYPHCDETLSEVAEKDFKAGFEFTQRWIPVEDELPETSEIVNVKCDDLPGIVSAFYEKIDKCWYIYPIGLKLEFVTHWRPIEYK